MVFQLEQGGERRGGGEVGVEAELTEMSTRGSGDVDVGGGEQLGSKGGGELGEVGFWRTGGAVAGAEDSMVHNGGSGERFLS